MRALLVAAALLASTIAGAAEPAGKAEPAEKTAWELDAFVGYGQLAFPWPDTSTYAWWNGGPAFAVSVAYRGLHFTHPFLDVSYLPVLASGRSTYLPGTNGTTFSSSSQNAIGLAIGPGWDVDWFRVRVGVGLYDVLVSSTVDGVKSSTSSVTVGFMAALAAQVWRPDPFALGVEARLVGFQSPTSGFYQAAWQLGINGRWDFSRSP